MDFIGLSISQLSIRIRYEEDYCIPIVFDLYRNINFMFTFTRKDKKRYI